MGLKRRAFIGTAAGAAAIAARGQNAQADNHKTLDLSKPEDSLTALAKLRGDITGAPVFTWYSGIVTGLALDQTPRHLYRMEGVIKSSWTPQSDGSFKYLAHDLGFAADLDTGKPLERFTNPYTGEKVEPIETKDGPIEAVYSLNGTLRPGQEPDPSRTLDLPWVTSGDDVWIETSLGFGLPNPLDPEEWPAASTGKTIYIRFETTYKGRLSELSDPDITSARSIALFSGHASWPPWLLMGERPGFVANKFHGRKAQSLDEIDDAVLTYLDTRVPGFFEAQMPWTESASSWQRYKEGRTPKSG